GGKLRFDEKIDAFVPDPENPARTKIVAVGAANGEFGRAGAETAGAVEPLRSAPQAVSRDKRFVDIQDDVTVEDIELAHRENFRSVEHLKRYTTLGMGTDQGKTSNLNGLALMAKARGVPVLAVGTTRFRPPYN